MEELFEKAEREGLWFYTNYQQLWFSPKELREYNNNGQYRWSSSNWTLRNPAEKMEQLTNELEKIQQEMYAFMQRMSNE